MNRLLFVLVIPAVGCASGAPPADGGITSTLGLALRSGAITVEQTATATVQVDLTRTNYAKPVAVTLTGLDAAGITADALLIDPSSSTGTLVLHAAAGATAATTTGTVQGNGGDATASINVTVRARVPIRPLAIAITPGTVTLPRGGQATIQVDLTRIDDPDPVTIAAAGFAAAGIDSTAVLLDATHDTALLVLFASPAAPLGTTVGTVQANDGDASAPLTVTVVASGPFSLDFGQPVLTLTPGGSTFGLVTVTRVGGFAGTIGVGVTGLPAGVTVDPLSIPGTEEFGFLNFHSDGSGSAVSGVPITITGTSSAASASTTFALTLPGLSLSVLSRALFIGQGQTAVVSLEIAALSSVAGPRTLTISGLPPGVAADETRVPEGETSVSLLLIAAADAPPATAALTVTATSGSTTASAGLTVTVERNVVHIASIEPGSVTVAAGTSKRVVVAVTRTGSFRTFTLPISASGLSAGVTADAFLLPPELSSGVLVLRAAADAALGGPVAASINAGTDLDNAPLALTVVAPFDFAFAAPSVSLQQGSNATPALTLTRNAGFGGSVALQVSGLPAGVTARTADLGAGTSSGEIDLAATAAAAAGSSVISVTASGAGYTVSHALPLEIFVAAADSPSIVSFAPAAGTVFVGERTQLTAVFTGDSASVDGIGPVQSGLPIDTPVLSATTRFTLRVRRGSEQVDGHAIVGVAYRKRFRELAAASVGRGVHLAATLTDGTVLLMGGHTSDALVIPSNITTQRFDPVAEATTNGPDLPFFENTPETAAVQLADGGFLLVGGGINSNSQGLGADADRLTLSFGPTDQRFVRVGNTQEHRHGVTLATALLDGGALLTGGTRGLAGFTSTERFDPTTRHWSEAGPMSVGRRGHTATRLADGRVLVVAGLICCKVTPDFITQFSTDTAEIYDPDTGQFTPTGSLASARSFHTATLLPDGRVLVVGGLFGDDANPSPTNTEVYDPTTGAFAPAGDLQTARGFHSGVLLSDGRVLVVGGVDAARPFVGIQPSEIYDAASNSWSPGPVLQRAWTESTVTLLGNGKVLIFGGETPGGDPVSTVMLFE
ncbi:MAG TPA: kelch repeat-containing protein [Myxococcales bacterium]|nr:kelch repeat-containing protein [Myxococcales bacterium]